MRLKALCPSCSCFLAPFTGYDVATNVVKRTCRKCRNRWQIVVRPMAAKDGLKLHECDFKLIV